MGGFISAPTNLASPSAIGSTTPNTGRFTTLTLAPSANTTPFTASGYSLTGTNAQSLFDLSGTWNTSGTPTAFKLNVTDTASNASSLLMDLQVGGASVFKIIKGSENSGDPLQGSGIFVSANRNSFIVSTPTSNVDCFIYTRNGGGNFAFGMPNSSGQLRLNGTTVLTAQTNGNITIANSLNLGGTDLVFTRDAANIFAQRNSTNAQTFRIYNTFTDASNYERGFMRWATNVLEIGAEAAGTGTQRTLVLKVGSTDALTITTSGQASFASRVQANNFAITGTSNFIYNDPISNGFRFTDGSGTTNASGGFFLYNSYTNTTNNERGFVRWGSNRFQVGTISIGTGTARTCEVTFYTSASDPTSSDITSGYFSVWKNSGTGIVKLWVNDGGTMKSVALV